MSRLVGLAFVNLPVVNLPFLGLLLVGLLLGNPPLGSTPPGGASAPGCVRGVRGWVCSVEQAVAVEDVVGVERAVRPLGLVTR